MRRTPQERFHIPKIVSIRQRCQAVAPVTALPGESARRRCVPASARCGQSQKTCGKMRDHPVHPRVSRPEDHVRSRMDLFQLPFDQRPVDQHGDRVECRALCTDLKYHLLANPAAWLSGVPFLFLQ